MRVSVIICTWNRCELLRRTLESFRSLIVPSALEWQLLVVNNHSTDATEEVIAAYRDHLPLQGLFEPEEGVSRARNTGARAASGDLVLFTDDDVRVDPGWMSAFVEAARQWPDAGFFAGRIRPEFAPDVPKWVTRNQRALAGMLCLRDGEPISRRLRPGELAYGPNMAVRRAVLQRAMFDEHIGRRRDEQLRGSEASLLRSLRRQGITGVWVPDAMIQHYVPGCRANYRYLWNYYHGAGRTEVRLTLVCGLQSRWQLAQATLMTLGGTCRRPLTWSRHLATVAWMSGEFSELWRLALAPDTLEVEGVQE